MSQVILTATNALSALELERLRLVAPSRKVPVSHLIGANIKVAIANGWFDDEKLVRDVMDNHEVNFYTDAETDSLFVEYKFSNLESLVSSIQRYNDADEAGIGPSGLIESDITNLSLMTVYPLDALEILKQWHVDLYIESIKRAFYL